MTKPMIKLEPFERKDFQRLISWIDDKESLVQFAGTYFDYPLTEDQLENYLSDGLRTIFRARATENQKIIGHAEIFRVEKQMSRLCRILIGEKGFRGRGYGQEIISKLLDYAFQSAEVEAVELNVYKHNSAAIKCYEKAGFRMNPSANKITVVDNKDWASLNMVLTRGDWKKEFHT